MPKKKEEEPQTTLDLDQAMEEGMEKFQGELAEAAKDDATPETTPEETSPAKEEKGEEKPAQETEVGSQKPEIGSKKTEDPKEEVSAKETPPAKEEKPGTEEAATRFKTHGEAEKGYRHIQGEKTRLEQELKQEREARAAEKKAREEAAEKQAAFEEAEVGLVDYATERHEQALTAIDVMDPDDEGYQKKVARIWAEKDRDIRRYEREHGLMEAPVKVAAPETTDVPSVGKESDDVTDAQTYVAAQAREKGIDPDGDEFFKLVCKSAPTQDENGRSMTFDEQIDWAVNKTKTYHADLIARSTTTQKVEADRKAAAHQEQEIPMGRSASDAPSAGKEAGKPVSLDDAVESAREERRL